MTKERIEAIIKACGYWPQFEEQQGGTETVVLAHSQGGTVRLGSLLRVKGMSERELRQCLALGRRPSGGGNIA